MRIEPLEKTPGAIVRDMPGQFTTLAPADADTLRVAYGEFGLLVFRGRQLAVDEQLAICASLGSLVDQAGIGRFWFNITNLAGGYDGELCFHSDFSNAETLLSGASLYASVLPTGATATVFAHAGWALDAMPDEGRHRLDGLRAIHCAMDGGTPESPIRRQAERACGPRAEHPVIMTHPETGRRFILLNDLQTEAIQGLAESESMALIDELNNWIRQPQFVYRHEWQLHDLVVWDQLVMQHSRAKEVTEGERTLRRVSFTFPGWLEGSQQFFDSLGSAAGKSGTQDTVQ